MTCLINVSLYIYREKERHHILELSLKEHPQSVRLAFPPKSVCFVCSSYMCFDVLELTRPASASGQHLIYVFHLHVFTCD